jgi:hypothetical protein
MDCRSMPGSSQSSTIAVQQFCLVLVRVSSLGVVSNCRGKSFFCNTLAIGIDFVP